MAYLCSLFPRAFSSSGTATPLAPTIYHDPKRLQHELRCYFASTWHFIAIDTELETSGDTVSSPCPAASLVVARSGDGGLRGFINACPRRQHLLQVERCRHAQVGLDCALHGLHYTLDGSCRKSSEPPLATAEVEVVGRLVFARAVTTSTRPPAVPALPAARLAEGQVEDIPVDADWKVIVELLLEGAQESDGPLAECWSLRAERALAARMASPGRRLESLNAHQWLESTPAGPTVWQVWPVAAGRATLRRVHYSILATDRAARAARYLRDRIARAWRHQMVALAESIQRSVESASTALDTASISETLQAFHRQLEAPPPPPRLLQGEPR
jgi:phenylpropionate dioxygenase-like ring-hydroxylating dioxygenase large terminal subunit